MKTARVSDAACASRIYFAIPSVTTSLAEADIQILHHETGHLLIDSLMNHTRVGTISESLM
jgi:hypothetical protein